MAEQVCSLCGTAHIGLSRSEPRGYLCLVCAQPWEHAHVPWFARLRVRVFGCSKCVVFGSDAR